MDDLIGLETNEPDETGVHVVTRGGEEDARIRFAYLVEGELAVGNVADYAHALEEANYGGLEVSPIVWVWGAPGRSGPEVISPRIETSGFDRLIEDARTTVSVSWFDRTEVATYRIDGRA